MWDPTPNLPQGYGGLLILVAFVAAMVWIVWMGWRRAQFAGASEVSAAEQALLGQEARAMYVGPEFRLCNIDAPSEFDSHVLSLFDSIEANRDDIDIKIENVRAFMKSGCTTLERFKNKQKLDLVYRNMAAYLVRSKPERSRLGMQQLLASWGMVGRLASSSEGPSKVPAAWIRPLVNDSAPKVSYKGSQSRGMLVLSPNRQALVGALFFSVTGTMIAFGIRPDLTTDLAWGVGIFLTYLALYKLGVLKPYKSSSKR
jgi:hypothetical protein